MDLQRYEIKKGKTDLLSSLNALNEDVLKEYMDKKGLRNIKETKKCIIEEFSFILGMCTDDFATRLFFNKLVANENTDVFSPHESDVESLIVFVYKKDGYYTYYIPDEIKRVIKKTLG